ncbi:sigma 54-interacting transcriptional regulator [Fusibacter paucivorans]|uniref:Sigma 54-interacting transcriptional regulator n=1 Tax=Fusibacter paucivorans TaxID=76009 RepID=A0ABS5PM16_9FIRM|nr:sigma 54-interacting transcriptional regulator [Fusibacter paucivorans]MBS7526230.1 sigma 54-interacting transcriptional regulator [Fusibacter paucivorans]
MAKIGVVWHYIKYEEYFRIIAESIGETIYFKLGNLYDGIRAAKALIEEADVEVIIARGYTGELIRESVEIPVVVMENSNFDLINAVHKAHELGEKIAFVDYQRNKQFYDFELIKRLLDIDFDYFTFNEIHEIEGKTHEIAKKGYDVVIGTGSCVFRNAFKSGIDSVLLETSREDFISAINRAKATVEIRRRETEKNKWMKAIYDNAKEGYMLVTGEGKITVFNEIMSEIFNVESESIIGKEMSEAMKVATDIRKVYAKTAISGELIDVNRNRVIVNRFPIDEEDQTDCVLINLQKASNIHDLDAKLRHDYVKKGFVSKTHFDDIITKNTEMLELIQKAKLYAKSKSNILIYGESGTGKELFAQSIHRESTCAAGPFVAINCASLPENLLESELFGYEEGAFTGARKGGKLGIFELAHKGTIFLDEIGEMSIQLQSRFLRVLQEREVIRLGGDRVIPVDVRIICATNKNLFNLVVDGKFREDLYYRINILKLSVPPLRQRKDDIWCIFKYFLNHKGYVNTDELAFLEPLMIRYDWPGNVRELQAFGERLMAMRDSLDAVTAKALFSECVHDGDSDDRRYKRLDDKVIQINLASMNEMENQIIQLLYEHLGGDKDEMANILNISKTTLWRKLKEIN